MNWHRNCTETSADVTGVIELIPGCPVPYCNSCGEIAPSQEDGTKNINSKEIDFGIPSEPPSGQRRLHWPSSVRYVDESPLGVLDAELDANVPRHDQQDEELEPTDTHTRFSKSKIESCFKDLTGTQIRLLELQAGELSDPLHFELLVVDSTAAVQYEALSYTWANDAGVAEKTCSIYHGRRWDIFKVTENCRNALRRLRLPHRSRKLWVDAICINQEDYAERNHQVDMMAQIYACAHRVIIYLGENEPDGDSESEGDNGWNSRAIQELYARPYFSRIWVVQEIALAKDKTVICGSKSWDWDLFYSQSGTCTWIQHCVFRKYRDSSELFELLLDTASCKSSDKRDRIFALFGLIVGSAALGLTADYSLDLAHVMIGISAYLLTSSPSETAFGLLLEASINPGNGRPSWVPDWTGIVPNARELNRHHRQSPWALSSKFDCYKGRGIAFCKQTGGLRTIGIRLSTGHDLQKPYYETFMPRNAGNFWVSGKHIGQGDTAYYLPELGCRVLICTHSSSSKQVVGRLAGVCTSNPLHAPLFPSIRIQMFKRLPIRPLYEELFFMSNWVKALFRSDHFSEIKLDRFVPPWDRLIEVSLQTTKSRTEHKRLQTQTRLRQALLIRRTVHIQELLNPNEEGMGRRQELVRALLSYYHDLRAFSECVAWCKAARELLYFVKMLGSFLEGKDFNDKFWTLAETEISFPQKDSFRDSLARTILQPSSVDSVGWPIGHGNEMLGRTFADFLASFVATHHVIQIQQSESSFQAQEQDALLSKKLFTSLASLCSPMDDATFERQLQDTSFEFLDEYRDAKVSEYRSILSTFNYQDQARVWDELEMVRAAHTRFNVQVYFGLKNLTDMLYKSAGDVFKPELFDLCII